MIKKYPRLSYLLIGTTLGIMSVIFTIYRYNEEIERVEELNERIHSVSEDSIARLTLERNILKEEVKSLKSRTKVTETRNVDGSFHKIYENDTETKSESRLIEFQQKIATLQNKIKSLEMTREYEQKIIEKSRPSASFSLGINTNLKPYVIGTYNFSEPWILQGYLDQYGTLGLGLGVSM